MCKAGDAAWDDSETKLHLQCALINVASCTEETVAFLCFEKTALRVNLVSNRIINVWMMAVFSQTENVLCTNSIVAKFSFKLKWTALMTVLQRPTICVFFLSFIEATLNEVYTLLMSILQRNELWKNSSKHVPTVHTKDCISHALCFHKTFPTICCWPACTSLSFLQLKFANRKAFQC